MKSLNSILLEIEQYNTEIYNSFKPTEKIDFSLTKKNWGSNIIPKKFWIDPNKKYITRNGYKVENLSIIMKNSNENEVTFPIKGTLIIPRKNKTDKKTYEIWTLDGRKDINRINGNLDLILDLK